MWYSVVSLNRGQFIKLIVTVQCPRCGHLMPMGWTGLPTADMPVFDDAAWCGECDDIVEVQVPEKSLSRWLQFASMELQQARREDVHRYIYKMSGQKQKQRKNQKTWTDMDRARTYGSILRNPGSARVV